MAAINFVEQKEFGSVIQPEFNPSNNIIRGEWVDSIFRHRTKKHFIYFRKKLDKV